LYKSNLYKEGYHNAYVGGPGTSFRGLGQFPGYPSYEIQRCEPDAFQYLNFDIWDFWGPASSLLDGSCRNLEVKNLFDSASQSEPKTVVKRGNLKARGPEQRDEEEL